MDCDNVITLENVGLELGGRYILKNVSLEIHPGEVHLILGRSGSGKASLLNVLNGLYKPSSGHVVLHGEKIGYYHQELALIENISIYENLKIFGLILGQAFTRKQACQCLEKLGLSEQCDQDVSCLSGGERQRAAFAKLLLFHYDVILIDEPTNNLDDMNVSHIIEAIHKLKRMKSTVVLVSHCQRMREVADAVFQMEEINEGC